MVVRLLSVRDLSPVESRQPSILVHLYSSSIISPPLLGVSGDVSVYRRLIMNRLPNIFRTTVLLLSAALWPAANAAAPDFSICEGLSGVAGGLCRAGVAVGCDQHASRACERIEAQYTDRTGEDPPWADKTIFVTAEIAGHVPLDGAWGFDCENDDPGVENDVNELLIFLGDTVEAREVVYQSKDATCTGILSSTLLAAGTVAAYDEFMVTGWINEDGQVAEFGPLSNDGSRNLNLQPYVVPIEFIVPGAPIIERTFMYVDDTADPWCFYREDGDDDDVWGQYLSSHESRCKQ